MDYSELIYLYIDGEASEAERTLLFSALATDAALQAEFNDAFRMNSAVQKEIETTVPPPELTSQVFEKAGFVTPDEPSRKKAGWLALLLLLMNSRGIPLLTAVGGALIMYGVMRWNSGAEPSATIAANDASPQSISAPHKFRDTTSATPSIPNESIASQRIIPTSSSRIIPSERTHIPSEHLNSQENTKKIVPDLIPVRHTMSALHSYRSSPFGRDDWRRLTAPQNTLSLPADDFADLVMQVSGHSGLQDRGDASPAMLNNMSISIASHLSPNHLLGGQLGQESFPIFSSDGTFERNVNVMWIGALYRYEMDGIQALGGIQPFAQVVAAGTRSGPLGKGTLGVMWQPESRIILSFGLEATALVYQFQSASYGTQKLGMNYGISVKF
ncbi:MAG: hypothetical protein U0264_13935 [Candidatus Kapaibacterium sp.]